MGTFTKTIYQVVFREKYDSFFLNAENKNLVFPYMAGVLKNRNCHPYAIGGFRSHVHLVFELHPLQSLSSLVKDLKLASNKMMKSDAGSFGNFKSWQNGYGGFTYHASDKNLLISYENGQEKHH